jgi:predicted nucleotidyltransferase
MTNRAFNEPGAGSEQDGVTPPPASGDWQDDRRARTLLESEPKLHSVVSLAQRKLKAEQVWVFGSRATGKSHADSDWDIFLVLPDKAPEQDLDPMKAWSIGREAGLIADVVAERDAEVRATADVPNTLSYVLRREGVRVG